VIFHHTDSARLPWIINAGTLMPATDTAFGIYPDPDFLWATTDPRGDPTATASQGRARQGYRDGDLAMVRFALDEADFLPWTAIRELYPQWTPEVCALLERTATPRVVAGWRCRVAALPADRWGRIEFRTWSRPAWRKLEDRAVSADPLTGALWIKLDGARYFSRRIAAPGQAPVYRCGKER
jgi:hypothetical protein